METAVIILAIFALYGNYKYYQTWKRLHNEMELHQIRYDATKDWKFKHDKLESLYQECWELLTERSEEVIKYKLVIESRDIQIIELEKKVAYLTNGWNEKNDVIADFSRRISDYKTMYAQSQMQNTKLENYGREMYKLNNDMCKKLVMLRIDLEIIESKLLTKTAPFGKGNK
jgi:IS4 transposase